MTRVKASLRTAVAKEIARITAQDTHVLQVRQCRGCLVWHKFQHNSNNNSKAADDQVVVRQQGVCSFGGMGILVLSDQRILGYVGATRLFHAKWDNATISNFDTHIEYGKDRLLPLLCLTMDASSLFAVPKKGAAVTTRTTTCTKLGDVEYRFETVHASFLKRRIQYILHWYLDLECAPGTQRRYATEIYC